MNIGLVGAAKLLLLIQASKLSVAGVISDGASGHPLAGAVVTLPDLDRSVISDSAGRYQFLEVPPGPQHLAVRCIGYAPRTLHALVSSRGQLRIDIALLPVPMQLPAIVVRWKVPLRGVEPGDSTPYPERSVSAAELRSDPLLAEPDGLLGLTGGEISADLETPSGLYVRGGASDQTRYLLDGIPVFSPYHTAGLFTAWNPDALERLELTSAARGFPDALSGVVSATTRTPGPALRAQGGMSTTQGRVAIDGPVGARGAGYLLSFRTGFPGLIAPRHDGSYLSGDTQDLLLKGESPAFGGTLHLLVYDSRNAIGSALLLDSTAAGPLRNGFEWASRSAGARWSKLLGTTRLQLQTWSASSEAEATWVAGVPLAMRSERQDFGALALLERSGSSSRTTSGVRIERSHTMYGVRSMDGSAPPFEVDGRTPIGSLFLEHERAMGKAGTANLAVATVSAPHGLYLNFQGRIIWRPASPLALSASYGQTHQFSQSLRNPESVVGNIFPAELHVGAGATGIPVAGNRRGVIAAEYRPGAGVRLGAQAFVSSSDGLLLVAPRTGEPFATAGYTIGSGTAPGFSVDAVMSGSRYGLLARYGWQRVRLEHADSTYTPLHGTGHLLELGAVLFPTATSSIRIGLTGAAGRHATAVTGAFEWEACNLLDRGCEFGGTPQTGGALGAVRLPAYLRLDLSFRKHWHINLAHRDVTLELFGTLSNLLGRTNLLTVATDPATGRTTAIEMRPRAPLVAGFDWRF